TFTLQATSSAGLTSVTSGNIVIAADPPRPVGFRFVSIPATGAVGVNLPDITVEVIDQFGNRFASTPTISLSIATGPGGGNLTGTTSQAAVAGLATFPGLQLSPAGTFTLRASNVVFPDATSGNIVMSNQVATSLAFVAAPPAAVTTTERFGAQVEL